MALVEEYYELNEAEEVSAVWKVTQIGFYVSAACLGLWCGYTIALLRLKFQDKCYLFTSIKVPSAADEKFNPASINWESDYWCDYCQYSMVSSFIVATIWATFFLMCGKGGKSLTGLPQPWRIVWPSLIFNFTYFVVALTTAVNIQHGTDSFCLNSNLRNKMETKSLANSCPPLEVLPVKDVYITSLQLEIVTKTSWGCVVSWLIVFLISFARIIFVIDFNLYKICVFKIGEIIQNKKEEVLKITNYEDPRKIYADGEINQEYSVEFEKKEEEKPNKGKVNKIVIPTQPNAAFYVTTDIRLLSREKQRKKSFKLLDTAFEKSKANPGVKQIRHAKLDSVGVANRLTSFSRQYDPLDLTEGHFNDDEESSSGSRASDSFNTENEANTSCDQEPDPEDLKKHRLMRFKKCI